MNELFPDPVWNYKNFNMVVKLDISGEFIYDGIQALNEMSCIEECSSLFSFLYHVSVGVERLQKIIIVLFEDINSDSFEKSLITHSHSALNSRIIKSACIALNSRENKLLQILTEFYKASRYNRFNLNSNHTQEENLLSNFVIDSFPENKIQRHFISRKIILTTDLKEWFGRIIGSITQKYYLLVREVCKKNNTFTYELRPGSKAEKVFLCVHSNNSLQEQKFTEAIAFKELLVYYKNTSDSNAFMRYIEKIKPLNFDIALINEYFSKLCKGNISESLIDEVEYLYEESEYSVDRMNQVDRIGNTDIMFDYTDILECIEYIENTVNQKILYVILQIFSPKNLLPLRMNACMKCWMIHLIYA